MHRYGRRPTKRIGLVWCKGSQEIVCGYRAIFGLLVFAGDMISKRNRGCRTALEIKLNDIDTQAKLQGSGNKTFHATIEG